MLNYQRVKKTSWDWYFCCTVVTVVTVVVLENLKTPCTAEPCRTGGARLPERSHGAAMDGESSSGWGERNLRCGDQNQWSEHVGIMIKFTLLYIYKNYYFVVDYFFILPWLYIPIISAKHAQNIQMASWEISMWTPEGVPSWAMNIHKSPAWCGVNRRARLDTHTHPCGDGGFWQCPRFCLVLNDPIIQSMNVSLVKFWVTPAKKNRWFWTIGYYMILELAHDWCSVPPKKHETWISTLKTWYAPVVPMCIYTYVYIYILYDNNIYI